MAGPLAELATGPDEVALGVDDAQIPQVVGAPDLLGDAVIQVQFRTPQHDLATAFARLPVGQLQQSGPPLLMLPSVAAGTGGQRWSGHFPPSLTARIVC